MKHWKYVCETQNRLNYTLVGWYTPYTQIDILNRLVFKNVKRITK